MIQFLQVDDEVQLEGEKPHSDLHQIDVAVDYFPNSSTTPNQAAVTEISQGALPM